MSIKRTHKFLNWDRQKTSAADEFTKEKVHKQEASDDVTEEELRREVERGQCPFCGIYKLIWDEGCGLYECLSCRKAFKQDHGRVFIGADMKHRRQGPFIQGSLV